MVMVVHSTEPFYLGGEGSRILTESDACWASFFDSFVRSCVPLFVIASSYLLFPVQGSTGDFFRRRLSRLLVPFVVWSLFYAFYWGNPVENLKDLLLNFNYSAGHLWFVYMLLGVYLLMPLLSPWAERVGRRELQGYLSVWGFTLLIPFIREWASGGELHVIYGPTGIPNPAAYPLWGEASWNGYGLFYYVSGFVGYLLFGLYFRRFVPELTWHRTLLIALPTWLAGFLLCFGGFLARVYATSGLFPVEGSVDYAVGWETPWYNDTLGVALMAIGWVLLFRKFQGWNPRMLTAVSKASYGMYLCHMVVLATASALLRDWLRTGNDGILGFWTTPVEILSTALSTFLLTALVCSLLQRLPRVGKWVVG
jgi:surface polysaccharide O-acyltransferase-like enzyme